MSRSSKTPQTDVEKYIIDHSLRLHPMQEKLIEASQVVAKERIAMLGSADSLQLLANLAKSIGAKKTLDIGVFTGYSALTIGLALPEDGRIVACDVTDMWLGPGKEIWKEAAVDHKIDLRLGPAVETLEHLISNGESGTYDLAFIDADKPSYCAYYKLCKTLVRPGGIIAVDNVLWNGRVVNPSDKEIGTQSIRALNDLVAQDKSVDVNMLSVGDGLTLVFKR